MAINAHDLDDAHTPTLQLNLVTQSHPHRHTQHNLQSSLAVGVGLAASPHTTHAQTLLLIYTPSPHTFPHFRAECAM